MKNSVKSILFVAAVALVGACSKNEETKRSAPAEDEVRVVHFTAASPETRTHFGEKEENGLYPVLWDADDEIRVSINSEDTGSGNKYIDSYQTTVSADGRTASFAVRLLDTKPPKRYLYYAYTPVDHAYEKDNTTHGGGFYANPDDRVRLWIPTVQTPTATTVDRSAQILFGQSEEYASYDDPPTLHFTHFTAYGKLSLQHLALDAGDAVESVTLAASANNLTGGYVHNPVTGEVIDNSNTHSTELQIVASDVDRLWFGCFAGVNGVNDLSGTALTIRVETKNQVTFTRTVDLADKTLKFEAGRISVFRVDMASAEKVTPSVGKRLEAFVDFGKTANGAAPWNNFTAFGSGTQIALADRNGESTAVRIEVAADFTSAWAGATAEPSKTIVSNGVEWPLNVWRDALVVSGTKGGGNTPAAAVRLSGLDAAKTYRVTLLAVRYNGGIEARKTEFTLIGAHRSETSSIKTGLKTGSGAYASWDAVPFDQFTAVFSGIAPDADGCIRVEVVGVDTGTAAEGHLNALAVAEEE